MVAAFAAAGVLAASSGKNACALVTAADVSSALKARVGAGTRERLGAYDACVYRSGKATVTVKTRPLSHAAYGGVVRKIPGVALKASDVSADAWVFFIANGEGLDDWKGGAEVDLVVTGTGANAVLQLKALSKAARARL
ncbi:MAG: hypothetical protein JO017_08345 [Actinobacteria bacterium]|nr:hypothetical protein [Actinomycetota bacterium]